MDTLVQEKEMATTAHMKTIDGDYCDGYYGWKGVKRAAIFFERKQRGRCVHASRPRTMAGRGRRGSALVTRRERMCGNRLGYAWLAVFR
jgi:hypothetical protein